MKYVLFLILLSATFTKNNNYPVALFHGMGDECSSRFENYFSKLLGGTYVKCIETGAGMSSITTSFTKQAEIACKALEADGHFTKDFSVLGLSQGALLGRYIIQDCDFKNKGTVRRYVSIGGPQMGVGKYPKCDKDTFWCRNVNKLVLKGVYSEFVQNHIGPAGYVRDIWNYDKYIKSSSFLADLNNERYHSKWEQYKYRILDLEKVVLIKFTKDTMIIPRETAWFEFYGNDGRVMKLEESVFYRDDLLGIRELNEQNKISFVELPGGHLRFDREQVKEHIIPALVYKRDD
jgi:palmitoyl-protein thioesterase